MLVRPPGDARLFSLCFQPCTSGVSVIGRIGPHHTFVAPDQIVGRRGVIDIGRRGDHRTDHSGTFIDTHMGLVAEGRTALAFAFGKARVRIVGGPVFSRRCAHRLDHGRIKHRPAFQDDTGFLKLPIQFGEKLFHETFRDEPVPEAVENGVVRSSILKAQPDKALERQPVVQRILQLPFRKPVERLQQQRPEQHQHRITRTARSFFVTQMAEHFFEAVPFDQACQTIQLRVAPRRPRQKRFDKARRTSLFHRHMRIPRKLTLRGITNPQFRNRPLVGEGVEEACRYLGCNRNSAGEEQ